jgi:hypothetical protein
VTGESEAERAKRIVKEGEGWGMHDVANPLNVPVGEVRRARVAHQRDPWDGRPARTQKLSPDERQRRAAEWAAQGVPATVIAGRLDVKVITIRRDLGRRAA